MNYLPTMGTGKMNFHMISLGIGGKISLHADTGAEYFGNYTGRHIKIKAHLKRPFLIEIAAASYL